MIRAYLVDDEPLATERLERMLRATGRVDVVGVKTDPVEAVEEIRHLHPDVLFLDIHMPGLSGFELLTELKQQPLVIFTTAYDQYALAAFESNSIDYLLKPIERERLDRALVKAERLLGGGGGSVSGLLAQIGFAVESMRNGSLSRIVSRSGDKLEIVNLTEVTHFLASDKLTFAVTADRRHVVGASLDELEKKLNPEQFLRIHRSAIVNLNYLQELHAGFGGRMVARLKMGKQTDLPVARDRVRVLKERLGL
jgi:two-component system LytT family response regulator